MLTRRPTEMETVLRTIFRRCLKCPDITPSCPQCQQGEICSQIPYSCNQCARTECVSISDAQPNGGSGGGGGGGGGGTNPGVIAGGVIGGVVAIALVVFLVYKYCLKGHRRESEQFGWDEPVEETEEKEEPEQFTMRRDARASTHTVASLASTVLTRASNIIQIAYIPGVTNRGGPTSPDLLVPPVPPIPAAVSPGSQQSNVYSPSPESHYFFADEGRDSTYSGLGDVDARSSVARGSVASTIYRNNAVVGPQAQTIMRGKAAMVSVKSGNPGDMSPAESNNSFGAPPVPSIPIQLSEHHIPPASARNQETFNGGTAISTAKLGKPVPLNITKRPSISSSALSSAVTTPNTIGDASDVETNYTATTNPRIHAALAAASSTRPLADSFPSPPISSSSAPRLRLFPSPAPSPRLDGEEYSSPFADTSGAASPRKAQGLRTVIEEAVQKGSSTNGQLGQAPIERSSSPFGDEHALR